jgi:hypothetical protein
MPLTPVGRFLTRVVSSPVATLRERPQPRSCRIFSGSILTTLTKSGACLSRTYEVRSLQRPTRPISCQQAGRYSRSKSRTTRRANLSLGLRMGLICTAGMRLTRLRRHCTQRSQQLPRRRMMSIRCRSFMTRGRICRRLTMRETRHCT